MEWFDIPLLIQPKNLPLANLGFMSEITQKQIRENTNKQIVETEF